MIKFHVPNPFTSYKTYLCWNSKFQLFLFIFGIIMMIGGSWMLFYQLSRN